MKVENRDMYRYFLINCVRPAIKMNTLWGDRHDIIVSVSHVFPDDDEIIAEWHSDGWDVHPRLQPTNFPDYQVLDLGYLRAIRSLQYEQKITAMMAQLQSS
uniref:Uncharacterized protein n=1 Tax=Peronospora matthiolae TaxID=2874970 RepID=A0AAV1UFH5_9STRA